MSKLPRATSSVPTAATCNATQLSPVATNRPRTDSSQAESVPDAADQAPTRIACPRPADPPATPSVTHPIDSSIGPAPSKSSLRAMTLSELRAQCDDETTWLLSGLIARGSTTLITSQWKTGKTTLLTVLLARMARGGLLAGLDVAAGSAAVVSEEAPVHWIERARKIGLGDHVFWFCRPFHGPPRPEEWNDLMGALADLRRRHGVDLIAIDPLAAFLPGGSENDATAVLRMIASLQRLTELGAAVLLLHHPAKGKRPEGQSARGSGALAAAVDVLVEITRLPGHEPSDRRRKLRAWSRFDQTPRTLVLELTESGADYRRIEQAESERLTEQWDLIESVLNESRRSMTRKEIRADWPEDHPRPDLSVLWRWLGAAVDQGRLRRRGTGHKNDPYRYWPPRHVKAWRRWYLRDFPALSDDILDEFLGLDSIDDPERKRG